MAFPDELRDMVNTGMATSRDIVSKATAQAQVWGEMGLLKVEVMQYRTQAEKLIATLGAEAYTAFAERHETSLSADAGRVRELVERITELGRIVDEKEAAFRKLGGKESDLN